MIFLILFFVFAVRLRKWAHCTTYFLLKFFHLLLVSRREKEERYFLTNILLLFFSNAVLSFEVGYMTMGFSNTNDL